MPVGRGGGGHGPTTPTQGHFVLASREQDDGPVELNDRHLRSHGKIGDCEQSKCVQNVLTKTSLPCQILYKPKKNLLSAERPMYEFSATGLRRICKQWFSQ